MIIIIHSLGEFGASKGQARTLSWGKRIHPRCLSALDWEEDCHPSGPC
jgi:hypothetical protein